MSRCLDIFCRYTTKQQYHHPQRNNSSSNSNTFCSNEKRPRMFCSNHMYDFMLQWKYSLGVIDLSNSMLMHDDTFRISGLLWRESIYSSRNWPVVPTFDIFCLEQYVEFSAIWDAFTLKWSNKMGSASLSVSMSVSKLECVLNKNVVALLSLVLYRLFNTLKSKQNRRHFAEDIFKCIFVNENALIPIKFSPKFVPGIQLSIFQHCFI